MRSEVWLEIRSTQTIDDNPPNELVLTTEAELSDENGVIYLRYTESELTGLQGCVSTFEIRPDKVILRRSGMLRMETEFAPGSSNQFLYETEMGAMMISLRTLSIEDEMTVAGGRLKVDYLISLEGLGTSRIVIYLDAKLRNEG